MKTATCHTVWQFVNVDVTVAVGKCFFLGVDAKGWRGDEGKRETTIRADYLSGSVQPAVFDVDQAKQAKLVQ